MVAVAFQPVYWEEYVLVLVVAFAYANALVMVKVFDREDVSVMVVVPHSSEDHEPLTAAVTASRSAVRAVNKRILMRDWWWL